jgi:hypothetical protein
MKFPSWNDFRAGVTNFERYIRDEKIKSTERIQGLKDDHPVVDEGNYMLFIHKYSSIESILYYR